ncbi:MAG: radical SAM protein [Planctomycetota bacterium]
MASAAVLVVTGSLISVKDRSLLQAARKQLANQRASSGAWWDLRIKLLAAPHVLALRRERRSRRFRRAPYREAVERYFADETFFDTPELTEVALATLLEREGLSFEVATISELFEDARRREELLARCGVVFLSTTLLRDLSELEPVAALLKRPDNRVVAGGALTGIVHAGLTSCPGVDVVAVGYGEHLVPALAEWIRGGVAELRAPAGGRVERRGELALLFGGPHASRSLDALPTPDWSLAERIHGRSFGLVHYESVRGCPYRCSFCNYPFLFDDTVFRTKSASRIADEWAGYAARGVGYISCLDSLFTMPRARLIELCEALLTRGVEVRWLCYARADDLRDPEVCRLMRRAGCIQVQIGAESGNQDQLDNMNKRCLVEDNVVAVRNCRQAGIASFVSLILGFPGETPATIDDSLRFVAEARPDFCYVSPFTARVAHLPVFSPENRERFGLSTHGGDRASSPYWRHATMGCTDLAEHLARFQREMMVGRLSLDAGLFYQGMLRYRSAERAALLDFQRDAALRHRPLRATFDALGRWAQRRLERDVTRSLGPAATA